ncbi:RDD family protein [Litorimonas haliclonae]|uniref:RDD family protein n=1 Tax=Litorimonas haliclonae TaxID=2081977 RepID=UPI0039F09BB8
MNETLQHNAQIKSTDRRSLITPEGIDLQIQLADVGARIGAIVIDLVIINIALVLGFFVFVLAGITVNPEVAISLYIVFALFLRSFYFLAFEMGPKAATPGKRMMKIRVAARNTAIGQARLSANAIFARNALREIEIFLPLSFLMANTESVDGLVGLLGLIWSGLFLLFPLFNKDRLRAGDLIAGTWVVRAPKPLLGRDLAKQDSHKVYTFLFSAEQVEAYGIHELHVLETVLRTNKAATLQEVADRIRKKIKWEKSVQENDRDFLSAYYRALRKRLEARLIMGVRRKNKFDAR